MKNYSKKVVVVIALSAAMGGALLSAADHAAPSMAPEAALAKLKAGNQTFVTETNSPAKPIRARRLETAKGQHPIAVVVGCSDSRTPPELIFDQNIGDLFVVRTAGEVVGDYELGSIEYAVEHLGARLIVVMGHASCGAVEAAMSGESAPGHVGAIVRNIRPSVLAVSKEAGEPLVNAIKNNAHRVADEIRNKAELGSLASEVRVVESYYQFNTGKVEWLDKEK